MNTTAEKVVGRDAVTVQLSLRFMAKNLSTGLLPGSRGYLGPVTSIHAELGRAGPGGAT
jgi:hypothetical protein